MFTNDVGNYKIVHSDNFVKTSSNLDNSYDTSYTTLCSISNNIHNWPQLISNISGNYCGTNMSSTSPIIRSCETLIKDFSYDIYIKAVNGIPTCTAWCNNDISCGGFIGLLMIPPELSLESYACAYFQHNNELYNCMQKPNYNIFKKIVSPSMNTYYYKEHTY